MRLLVSAISVFIIMPCVLFGLDKLIEPGYSLTTIKQNESQNLANTSLFFAIINDNNTGNVERGKDGLYLGPDDFITVSALLRLHIQDWRGAITTNVITSRKFEYRYDLIYATISKPFLVNQLKLQPELGLVWKGNCGGEYIQNRFHRMKDLPELFVPYCEGGIGLLFGTLGSWQIQTNYPKAGIITGAVEMRLITDYVPSRISPMLGYQTELWIDRMQLEVLVGARFYLNEVKDYSDLIRSGMFFGVDLKTRVYQEIYFDLGLSLFPAQNLENDPLYMDKDHRYVPQIAMVFSWNSSWYGLYNLIDY